MESAYHPCGTCRMGESAAAATVVDAHCRVLGVQRLRVVDASIMPQATAGDLNAPTIMLAERAADLIQGKMLPPDTNATLLGDNHWQSKQRSAKISHDFSDQRDELHEALLGNHALTMK